MLALLISGFISLFLFFSFGILFSDILKIPFKVVHVFLLGLIGVNTILAILSFFTAIDFNFLVVLVGIGIVLSLIYKRKWLEIFKTSENRSHLPIYFFVFLLVGFITSLFPYRVYDTGLYYLQNIKWINEYPIVPGLANLHGRFGFNPSSFLLNSLTSLESIFGKAYFSLNFTLLGVLIFHYLRRIKDMFVASGLSNYLFFQIIIFCSILGMSDLVSTPTPDFIATSLLFFVFSSYTDLQLSKEKSKEAILPLILISFYLITIKLSTVPIIILFIFVLFERKFNFKFLMQIILLGSIVTVPWLIRNVVLTGWLLYPFPSLDLFNFDWQVPVDLVIMEKSAITGWARLPGDGFLWAATAEFREWFPLWWENLDIFQKFLILGSLTFPTLSIFIKSLKRKDISKLNPVIFTAFFGVLYWFLLAPDIRFGKAFIIVSLISPLLIFKFSIKPGSLNKRSLHIVLFTIFICYGLSIFDKNTKIAWSSSVQEIQKPADLNFLEYKLGDQSIYVPTKGDRCFNHKLPCTTPAIQIDHIEMRGNRLIEGFKSCME